MIKKRVEETKGNLFGQIEEALDWISSFAIFGICPGLERMEYMMKKLESPQRCLTFIHVAGTNGKGSTCAMLTSMLRANGYNVGMFTSPDLEKFTNRFKYNDQDIPDSILVQLVNELKPIVDQLTQTSLGLPTMFEISTAIAVLYYATVSKPDFVIWETGLGGRLDATNVITPILSIITNIGYDHVDLLGATLQEITKEKAGIIKLGVPIITTVEQVEALEIIRQTARTCRSSMFAINEQFHIQCLHMVENEQTFTFFGPFRTLKAMQLTMNGVHQVKNAAAALMALELLQQHKGIILTDKHIRMGLRCAVWPGRLEMIKNCPRLLIDGAHNPEGAATLAEALQSTYSYQRLHIMIGMLSMKHHSAVLRHILPLADLVIFTEPNDERKLDANSLYQIAKHILADKCLPMMLVERDWQQALRKLQSYTQPNDLALVTGTLYLIADVRSHILQQVVN